MSGPWIRVPAEPRHDVAAGLVAGALAAGVGLVTFYLVRTLLAREPVGGDPPPPPARTSGGEGGGA